VNIRLTEDDRLYVKAISMTQRRKETDMLRELVLDFIDPYRGDDEVEKAKENAVEYGLVPPRE
jgi:hypothetical protein